MPDASGGQLGAALAAAGGHDGPTGPGTHPQPETVGLGTVAVVRLECALTHGLVSGGQTGWSARDAEHVGQSTAARMPVAIL